jgi:hypothetical protein
VYLNEYYAYNKNKTNDFNLLNVFFSFLSWILLQQFLVHLKERTTIHIFGEKKTFYFSPDPNGKQRSFNCLGNSGRKVISFGEQSVGGSIS